MLTLELTIKNGPVLYYVLDSSHNGRNPAIDFSLPPKAMQTSEASFGLPLDTDLLAFWRENKTVSGWVTVTEELETGAFHTWWKGPISGTSVSADLLRLNITSSSAQLARKSQTSRLPRLRINELLEDLNPETPDRQEPLPEIYGTVYGLPVLLASDPNYTENLVFVIAGHPITSETVTPILDGNYLGSYAVQTATGPKGEYSFVQVPKSILGNQQSGLYLEQVTGKRFTIPDLLQYLANQYLPGEHKQEWRDLVTSGYAAQFLKSFSLGMFLNQELTGDVLTAIGQRLTQSFPMQVGFPAGKFSWCYTGVTMAPAIADCQTLIYGQDLWRRGDLTGTTFDQVRNNFVYTAGFDGGTGREKLQRVLNRTNSAFCRVSTGIWGETAEEAISFPDCTDAGTAHLVAEEFAALGAKCPYTTSYVTDNQALLQAPIGKFFALQDADWFSGNRLMRLDSVAYGSSGIYELGVTVFQ